VEGNPVFVYHDAFNPDKDEVNELKERYRKGKVGDVEVKIKLSRAINQILDPIRARRTKFENDPQFVRDVLVHGNERMANEAQETIHLVRTAMGLTYSNNMEVKENTKVLKEKTIPLQGLAFV
jgi:tryptophanyl-tRNA synthetase